MKELSDEAIPILSAKGTERAIRWKETEFSAFHTAQHKAMDLDDDLLRCDAWCDRHWNDKWRWRGVAIYNRLRQAREIVTLDYISRGAKLFPMIYASPSSSSSR